MLERKLKCIWRDDWNIEITLRYSEECKDEYCLPGSVFPEDPGHERQWEWFSSLELTMNNNTRRKVEIYRECGCIGKEKKSTTDKSISEDVQNI